MTNQSADKTVVFMGTITIGSVFLGSLYPCADKPDGRPQCGELPSIRPLIGALFAFGVLSAVTGPAPELVTGFALAVGTVAYLRYASPVVNSYFSEKSGIESLNNPIADALAKRAQKGE